MARESDAVIGGGHCPAQAKEKIMGVSWCWNEAEAHDVFFEKCKKDGFFSAVRYFNLMR
jgi:hypothetical protein